MQENIMMSDFMPHGHCYFWEPFILWSHALADSIIALAYMVIPFSLFYIFKLRKDFTYRWMVVLFAIFIFGCGITHIFDVINIWYPIYRVDSVARIITAMASIGTAVVLIRYTPKIIAVPTVKQWSEVNEELGASNEELSAANEELQAANEELTLLNEQLSEAKDEIQRLSNEAVQHSEQKYRDLAESISDIFFALDSSFCFTYWNKASEEFSGILAKNAIGKSLYDLYPHLKDTPMDQFYHKVIKSAKADRFVQTFDESFGNRVFEVNAYPTSDGISVISVDITAIEKSKKQVEEQKNQLELALWGADLGTWERDLVNDTLKCDERYEQITGIKPGNKESRLQDLMSRIHPADTAAVLEKLHKHEAGETISYQEQYRILKSPDQYTWVMSTAKVVERNEEGKTLRIVGVLQDITEIKEAEESTRFFKYLIDHTDDPTYWIDPHNGFRFVYVNEAACRHYGLPKEKLLKMSLPDWNPTFTMEKCISHWENIKKEKSLNFETVHLNAQGKEIPVEISTNYLKYGDKEYFGGHFKDISARKHSENKIIELQKRLEGIIDSAMDAIITTNEQQQIMIFNKAAEQMFGYYAHEIIGQPLSMLIPERFHADHHAHIVDFGISGNSNRKMGSNKAVFGINVRGNEFPIEASISQVKVGSQKYFTVIMRDISARLQREEQEKALNKELIRQNEQLQQFGFITSHNLRSPVASLLGLVEVFEEHELSKEIHKKAIQRIRETAEKMDEIIQDLNLILEYQKSLNAQREWISFEDTLNSIHILLAPSIYESGTEITSRFEVKELYSVKSYIISIFHNLLSNAIKYRAIARSPEIHIRTWQENDIIYIEFRDNGLGIDLDKNRGKLFGLYNRFHQHVEGRGMGLHLVKTQVEALNGKVEVDSKVGKGTAFIISLPVMKPSKSVDR